TGTRTLSYLFLPAARRSKCGILSYHVSLHATMFPAMKVQYRQHQLLMLETKKAFTIVKSYLTKKHAFTLELECSSKAYVLKA
ncbi:hypothetical protein STEG23_032816, partial [Scotinomys teguina]